MSGKTAYEIATDLLDQAETIRKLVFKEDPEGLNVVHAQLVSEAQVWATLANVPSERRYD